MRYLLISVFCLAFVHYTNSQCALPAPVPDIDCGVGTPLADNANISTGQTHYFNGSGGSFSNITLSGGTLVLCGSVNIANVNHNGGTVLIKPGASVVFTGAFNIGGQPHSFYNLGSVTFGATVQVQNSNQFVYNAAGAFMEVNGDMVFFNSGTFINYGTTIGHRVVINGSDISICLGPGAISMADAIESYGDGNHITVPVGIACLSYNDEFIGNAPVSATSNLRICQQPGADDPVVGVPGDATVIPNCSSCQVVLPLNLVSFKGNEHGGQVTLEWVTAFEENIRSFVVERSSNGQQFEPVEEVMARNQPSTYKFITTIAGDQFFRLKIIENDGSGSYSRIILMHTGRTVGWRLLSNPVSQSFLEVSIYVIQNQDVELLVLDNMGRIIMKKPASLSKGNNYVSLYMGGITKGHYYLSLAGMKDKYKVIPFIKTR